jgi:glycosyltransferase involved in cell wall biosynthesis
MVLLVNQLTIPVFLDIANAVSIKHRDVTLFTGHIEDAYAKISPNISVLKSFPYKRKSLFTRFLSWVAFTFHLLFYIIFRKGIKSILVVTNPPLAPIVVSWLARLRKIPYSLLVYDLYPEALSQAGISTKESWVFTTWKKINPSVFSNAQYVITLSESMASALNPYVSNLDRVKIIPNWVDNSFIKPIPKSENPFIDKYLLKDKLVVMYAGNMGLTHDLESLLDAAGLVQNSSEIFFILIGDGAKRNKLVSTTKTNKLTNVMFLPYQSLEEFPYAMAAADIGVVTLGLGAEGISVPSKTYINMAAGLCLLTVAPENSELNRLVETYSCGAVCLPGNPTAIATFLITMLNNKILLNQYKGRAREASLKFSVENSLIYNDLI